MLTRPVRWASLLAIAGVALWLRLVPLGLPGLDPATQELYRFSDAGGRSHVYLGDYDSYVWLRAAQNYLQHGTTCDEVRDGVCSDTQTHAPVGREMRYGRSMHIVAIVGLHRLITAVRPEHPLSTTAFLVPVLLGVLVVLPVFGIGRRLGGDVAGVVAAAAVAWNPFFFSRSAGSDNDVWNVVLPIVLVWAVARALGATGLARALGWTLLAAGVVGMHAGTWNGWPLGYGIVMLALVAHLIVTGVRTLRRVERAGALQHVAGVAVGFYVASFAAVAVVGPERGYFDVPLTLLQALAPALADAAPGAGDAATLAWPSNFEGVAELYRPSRHDIRQGVGGDPARLIGWLGFVVLLFSWTQWRWWHAVVALGAGGIVARLLYGAEHAGAAGIVLLAAPAVAAAGVRMLLDGGEAGAPSETGYDAGTAMVASIWFLAAMAQAPLGARFVLFLVPPFGVAFGHMLGRLAGAWRPGPRMALAATVAGVLLLLPTVQLTHALAAHYRPRVDDAWWDSFIRVRDEEPPDAILHLWWDHGYWAKYVAERRVSMDGGSLRTRIPHWTGRSLLAADEPTSVGLLRMLSCGSAAAPEVEGAASAFERLRAHGVAPRTAYDLVAELAPLDRAGADAVLATHGLAPPAREDVLAATHCTPPPALLMLTSQQVSTMSWKAVARWRPEGAPVLPQWRRDFLIEDWIECGVAVDGRWICPVTRRHRGRFRWLQRVEVDPAAPGSAQVTIDRPKAPGQTLVITPSLVIRAGDEVRTEMAVAAAATELALLLDESTRRVLVGPPDLLRSTFTQLLFLDGRHADRFEKVDERIGAAGARVVTFRIDWGGAG